ncbi:MAG: methyltransferase domain-containing protein [Actinomycetota bacterium]|nr:methyltransferase domain-containing protein [Actinomycetota bacterium]
MTTRQPAAEAWAEALGEWAIPAAILDAAPEEPWRFPPALFVWTPEQAASDSTVDTVSRRRAIEAIPAGGSVLDVGVGGGRASLPLVPPAALVVGVDSSGELLATFDATAAQAGVARRSVLGKWPDVADQVEPQDVVVCHHVAYNVADLVPFARALTGHARFRVVLEMTAEHPMTNLNEAWRVIHGIERPSRPTASDAVAVLEEMGLRVTAEAHQRRLSPVKPIRADVVAFARRRLCVRAERDPEIDRLLGPDFESRLREVVTVWWDGQAED